MKGPQTVEAVLDQNEKLEQENNELRAQLAVENQRASQLDVTCGELQKELETLQDEAWSCEVCGAEIESQVCRDCAIEEHEKYAKELEQTIKDRDAELTLLRTPPRCPKCGSEDVVPYYADGKWIISCYPCTEEQSGFKTVIEALNAWRKV